MASASGASYEPLFRSLASHSRLFPLCSADVSLLAAPSDFYDQLLLNIQQAEHRVSLSSLYLGTGHLERALVDALAKRLQERPELQVQIVLDYSRGQRGGVASSSVTMLAPLLKEFPSNVELFLFRVPQLSGLKAKLPPPFNETLGVSHAKVYLVDDTLVLSGANLSEDYFTNRQDRYVQLKECGALAQFYHQFVELVSGFSYKVKLATLEGERNDFELLAPVLAHDSEEAKAAMRHELEKLVDPSRHKQEETEDERTDSWAFPTLQFTPIEMNQDERVLSAFVKGLPRGSQLQIASGYLNFPPFLTELLERCGAGLDVISAAPRANGFYGAHGVKGALPMAYSLIEHDFFERTVGREFPTVLREFNRPGWTFHGKGMWWRPPPAVTSGSTSALGLPQLTVVGSSNFGQRSYGCDLESNLVMFTRNPDLQRRLQDEYDALTRDAEVVTEQLWRRPERMLHGLFSWKDGHWIRPVSKFIAAYL